VAAVLEPMPPQPEMRRRRSTVREPASVAFVAETTVPAPTPVQSTEQSQPVVSSVKHGAVDDRPRRSGWWSKRALGKE